MAAVNFAPARTATVAATWATRRLRRRRRTRREAIGAWWRDKAPIPQVAAATAGVGAGAAVIFALRRRASHLKDKATGAMHHVRSTETTPDNDQTLAAKVQTEIFRRPDAPKGAVNVSAVDGVVYLRGEVASNEEIERLTADALAVTGVLRVENMLHTPGTPAPTGGAG